MAALMLLGGISAAPAFGVSVTSAVFSGGTGSTAMVGGVLYAKAGATVRLTVATSSDARCVDLAGAFTAHASNASGQTSWTFTSPVLGSGNGAQAVTVEVSPGVNPQDRCTGNASTAQASFVLDNTGPVVTDALNPAPNAAGWNNSATTLSWTATDSGVGVAAAQPFQTETITSDGIVTRSAPAQADRLGNVGSAGASTVRVDTTAPTITATQTSAGYDQPTTVTFTCADATSGISSCLAEGSTTNAKTVSGNGVVTGTATDVAGNTKTLAVEVKKVDTTAPLLSGSPVEPPNDNGWYRDDVTVRWTAADPESGVPTSPADTTIGGEGEGLTSTTSVTNGAGLTTTATSNPAVKIDRTAPTTSFTGASDDWTNQSVTLGLTGADNLAGVDFTTYSVDGAAQQRGDSVTLSTEGEHSVRFFSTDRAGNVETARTVTVHIDRTAPTISHRFTAPDAYVGGWTNQSVTVAFECQDQGGSGLAGCSDSVVVAAEGDGQPVTGTARDNAGNSSSHTAYVSIDKTAPSVAASADREANDDGWYDDDVTVRFVATDALSGIELAPASQVLGEGAGQSATGTAVDAAGNSAQATLTGVNVDKTAPALAGTGPIGWHREDVTVTWDCADALSGVASAPADSVVEGEGDNLAATATCTDKAGNVTTETVNGIQIDRTAPTTLAEVPAPLGSGWYGAPVEVTLTGADGLSGVARTYYRVDGGTTQRYDGSLSFGEEGTHSIQFWSEDVAGNVEEPGAPITLKVDLTAPTTTAIHPISPASGWHVVSGIPFAFSADDGAGGAGIAATYYTIDDEQHTYGDPFTEDLSTGAHKVTYWSVDLAGNAEAPRELVVQVDTIAPTITGTAAPAGNGFGWNNTDVAVTFTCEDVGSGLQTGVAGCSDSTTLMNDGAGQSVRGDAVDVAGNRSATEVAGINIDKTKPTLTGVPSDPDAAGDWYRDDVTVRWIGDDGLSGINPATQPADTTVTGEGRGLSAGPATIADKAGNASDPASVTGIKIDRTGPTITGGPTAEPDGAGWYRGEVEVAFQCSDPDLADGSEGSGVASCQTSKVLSGNGANQGVTSDNATDVAGNVTPGHTVGGINIDGLAPTSTSNNTCTAENGWCKGDYADVVLTATDQAGLSGVKQIHYVVDDGEEQVAEGATVTVRVPLSGSGAGSVEYWAVDEAGNAERANAVALKWDNIAPTVSHSLSPRANAAGWNNADVTVTFTAKDDDRGSGVVDTTAPVTVSEETDGRLVQGTAKDLAGNVGSDSVTVRLDKTAPTITGAVTGGTLTPSGWYSGPVTVGFRCADGLSGIAVCPEATTLTDNGAVSATGTAYDAAGNSATTMVDGIRIDQERPTLTTADVNVADQQFVLGTAPAATCTATDSYSGLDSCTVTVTGGNANGVGMFAYTATAVDRAGNTTTVTGTYRVIYRFDGFLQPINDTAHQVDTRTSVFKAGSTVPAKFQLKRADGTIVQAATAPVWMLPVKGSGMAAPVDESVYTAVADGGAAYRYDATAKQYIYNWKTPSGGGNYYRIGVVLDDGRAYPVNIGLR